MLSLSLRSLSLALVAILYSLDMCPLSLSHPLPRPLPQEFVKLVSAEGAEFWVDRKCAMVSGTIKAMLSGTARLHRLD